MITGGSGFVGSNFQQLTKHRMYKSVSIRNTIDINEASRFDVILHCAALVHQMDGAPDSEYFKANSDLTYEIALQGKRCRSQPFIFMSTVKVYGESTTGKPALTKVINVIPKMDTVKAKLDAERRLMSLNDERFKVAIIRSPLGYGPGVKAYLYNLIRVVDKFPVLPFGCILNARSMVFAENLVGLIDTIIDIRAEGIFLASDSDTLSTTGLVKQIASALGKKRFLLCIPGMCRYVIKIMLPKHHERLFGSFAVEPGEGWRKIGYFPSVSTESGIQKTVAWYMKQRGRANE
jgi:UDP-glucose 4-epimerase